MNRYQHLADRQLMYSPLNEPPTFDPDWRKHAEWGERRQVVIYGCGLGHDEAPLDDPDWVVWALNLITPLDSGGRVRADLWWDIHQRKAQTDDDLRWIAKCPVPIIVPADLVSASNQAIELPLGRILEAFPTAPMTTVWSWTASAYRWMSLSLSGSTLHRFTRSAGARWGW